jgi:hypothetical protein
MRIGEMAALGVDIVLAALAIEAALIAAFTRNRRADLLIGLLPGLFLVLAVRFALYGAALPMLASLTAALPAHLLDLRRRMKPPAGGKSNPT